MTKKTEDYFVAMPNCMFAFDTDLYVTDEEFLLFYYLGTIVQARNPHLVLTNIEFLSSIMVSFDSNSSRRKSKIKKALLSLETKEYISIHHTSSEIKNNSSLKISIIDLKHPIYTNSVKSGKWTYMGFTQITENMYSSVKNGKQLKIISYVSWRSQIDYRISYYEWERVLDVSHQTAVKLISECQKKGLIIKHRGDYFITPSGEIRQETNSYEINKKKSTEFNLAKEINTNAKSETKSMMSIETRPNNWFETGDDSWLTENDFYIYLTSKCFVLKEHADKRIAGIQKSECGAQKIKNKMEKAENRIRQAILENEKLLDSQRDMIDTRETTYIPQKSKYDISHIIGND
ncbi:hypothetical protein ABE65_016255 [Fictibacillus phosphorivorans]|uniref:Uncharacterized protein n=1 Tax=Fictibacillus phosphorivorans TaxID=1221500 RepID=A0A160IPD2_9BACL|nr:hypothetical protein [Fictibacillus phosphorivorans]ANC78268.1 hypothetical protein ABE65_016255 [Fictibacillus phosphorivorans]